MKMYFYSNGTTKEGPFTLEELKLKDIQPKSLIWHEGLENWKKAENIDELKEIIELNPPPFINKNSEVIISKVNNNDENKIGAKKLAPPILKEANQVWIIAGFIFVILGGYLGVMIGLNYAFGNYNKNVQRQGWLMTVLGVLSSILWRLK